MRYPGWQPGHPTHGYHYPEDSYDAQYGQVPSPDVTHSHHSIGRTYDDDNDDSSNVLDTHDWLPVSSRFPGELGSTMFAFPVYVWSVGVHVSDVITEVPYIAIQAIRYRQGVANPLPDRLRSGRP